MGCPPEVTWVRSITKVASCGVQVPVTTTVPRSSAPNIGGHPGPRLTSTRIVSPGPAGVTTVAQGEVRPPSAAIETAARYAAGTAAPSVVSSGRTISVGSGRTHAAGRARSAMSCPTRAAVRRASKVPLLRPGWLPPGRRRRLRSGGLCRAERRDFVQPGPSRAQGRAPAEGDLPGQVGDRRAVVPLTVGIGPEVHEVVPAAELVLVVVRRRAAVGHEIRTRVPPAPPQYQGGERPRGRVVRLQ